LKNIYIRSRKWFFWENWHKATNPVRLAAGVWSFELKAEDNGGNFSKKTVYVGDTVISKLIHFVLLVIFAFVIMVEATQRFFNPVDINFKEAILVALIGLVVNILSAFLLHHDHEHSDHNIRAAYLHVIADALTSVSAILGLIAAMVWNIPFIDTIAALLSSFVIIKWSIGLLKDTGKSLLDIEHKHGGNNH